MPFNRPTLSALRARVANDIEQRVVDAAGERADAHTPGTGYTEIATVVAGIAHGLYGNQAWLTAQLFVDSADDDTIVREAAELGIPRIAAQFATGAITLTGNNGATIGADVLLQTSGQIQVRTTASATIVGGTAQVNVIAQAPGTAGNLATGAQVSLITPIEGLDSNATITAPGLSGGAEIERIERVRERVLARKQQPPMGGTSADYTTWARAAHPDVTRAWVSPHENGIGSITVRFVCENLADPIPSAGVVAIVAAYIDTVRPAGLRNLTVAAPIAVPLDLEFTLLTENTAAVHAAIEAEVKDLIEREYEAGGTLRLSRLREAISRATGEYDHAMTLTADLNFTAAQYPVWGTPTWP